MRFSKIMLIVIPVVCVATIAVFLIFFKPERGWTQKALEAESIGLYVAADGSYKVDGVPTVENDLLKNLSELSLAKRDLKKDDIPDYPGLILKPRIVLTIDGDAPYSAYERSAVIVSSRLFASVDLRIDSPSAPFGPKSVPMPLDFLSTRGKIPFLRDGKVEMLSGDTVMLEIMELPEGGLRVIQGNYAESLKAVSGEDGKKPKDFQTHDMLKDNLDGFLSLTRQKSPETLYIVRYTPLETTKMSEIASMLTMLPKFKIEHFEFGRRAHDH